MRVSDGIGRRLRRGHPRGPLHGVRLLLLGAVACLAGAALAISVQASTDTGGQLAPQGPKLVPADVQGLSHVGRGVALSGDGNTAVVGGPHDNSEAGAAWVFVRTGTTWTQQATLAAGAGEGSNFFGRAVAISSDGQTALVGDPGNAGRAGAAWVFTRSGETWTRQAKLVGGGEVGAGQFGRSVTLSRDGSVAMVGAYNDNAGQGAVWTFDRSGGSWAQVGTKLTATGETGAGWFGRAVSLSGAGTTALVGASGDAAHTGAAWVYTRSGSGWEAVGGKLTGTAESERGEFGDAVALSFDGSTGLVAGPGDDGGAGAAWVFTSSGSSWQQQGAKLTGTAESPPAAFGYSVSLSADGSTALAGAYADDEKLGAAWEFTRTGAAWTPAAAKLTGPGEVGAGGFGSGVALSADASTALIGGFGDNGGVGAVWPFAAPAPVEPEEPKSTGTTTTGTTTSTSSGTTSTSGPTTPRNGVLSDITLSAPVLAVSGNVEPVSGQVFIRLPGASGFTLLPGLRQIPLGSTIEATNGHVQVTTAKPGGGTETGEFFDGQFVLTQSHDGTVTVLLSGGHTVTCHAHGKKRGRRASAHSASRRKVRRLWANAHGTFSTKGNYAVGAVQGTEWLTEDRCDGTFIKVTRDKVKVTDLVRHRSFIVHVGHSVLVKP